MKYTLTINELDRNTIALSNLIRATSNVSLQEKTDEFTLSKEHIEVLNKRYGSHQTGEFSSFPHDKHNINSRNYISCFTYF